MKIIDLSVPVYEGIPRFHGDWHTDVLLRQTGFYERHRCVVHKLELCTHSGTHIDAPRHFIKDGKSIDQINPETFITNALVIDLSPVEEGREIKRNEFESFKFEDAGAVILNTGWFRRWYTGNYYDNVPTLSRDAALCLNEYANVKADATDIPLSVDVPEILLGAGKILIENIINLDRIAKSNVELIALPLKIRNGDGAPVRVMVIER